MLSLSRAVIAGFVAVVISQHRQPLWALRQSDAGPTVLLWRSGLLCPSQGWAQRAGGYSERNDSTGSSFAARLAGVTPAKIPMTVVRPTTSVAGTSA